MLFRSFLGYKLDRGGVPTFRYQVGSSTVSDRSELSLGANDSPGLKRTLRVESPDRPKEGSLWFRLADGAQITPDGKNTWRVDDRYQVTIPESLAASVSLRDSAGKKELLLPIPPSGENASELTYFLRW